MKSIEAYRDHAIETLYSICQRPGMYSTDAGLELFLLYVIRELCWIDEQEDRFRVLHEDLNKREFFQSTGVYGALSSFFHQRTGLNDELASIYCQLAYRLGYIHLERVLTATEWKELDHWFDYEPLTKDFRLSEIKELFGEPSFHSTGSRNQVHCYAGENVFDGWLCFDYLNDYRSWEDVSGRRHEWVYEENLLRDRRRTTGMFAEAIELTPFGRKIVEQNKRAEDGSK